MNLVKEFKRVDEFGKANGTCLQGYIQFPPKALVMIFGEPDESDGYKVSGEYVFEDDNGNVITLYDWKSTSLYDSGPSPQDFWNSEQMYNFHIGGHNKDDVKSFQVFLYNEADKYRNKVMNEQKD